MKSTLFETNTGLLAAFIVAHNLDFVFPFAVIKLE